MERLKWVLTCEHYSNALPKEYKNLFRGDKHLAESHRAYDLNAAEIYELMKSEADYALHYPYSRLLIEPNRSLHHPKLFSELSEVFSVQTKQELIQKYYLPYRNKIEEQCRKYIADGYQVLHLSVHSFTPELHGQKRKAHVGLLYDPKRPLEKDFSKVFKQKLLAQLPTLKVRFNYPYRGTADGFTTYLRKCFPQGYAGVELELRNDWGEWG